MNVANIRGCDIHYEEHGRGELIILLPGLGHDSAYYAKTLPLLADVGRAVAPDPRGLGRSQTSATRYSVEEWAHDVADLVTHLGAERAHLVGSSLGACVMLQAALDFPERVASLCLVAGFSELDRSLELNFRMRIQIIEKLGLGEVLAAHIAMWTLGRTFINTDEGKAAVERLFASVQRNSPERYIAFIRSILEFGRVEPHQSGQPKATERLHEVKVPTCIITGGEDILTPVSHAQLMADRIAGAELHVIPGCGHITFTERPQETAALIEAFLRKATSLA
jgi:pimeloyl-ACP methyl ester carboxylesterase